MLEGNTCPASRYGPGLFLGSLILRPASEYYEFFYPLLEPYRHYVPMHANLSDMLEKIQWARDHDAEAERIAATGRALAAEALSEASVTCYLGLLVTQYASLLRYTPSIDSTWWKVHLKPKGRWQFAKYMGRRCSVL